MAILRNLIIKAVGKAAKTEPSDVFTQMNADDVVTIIKSILF